MARTITHEMPYDAPVERVVAMLADPGFREEVCRFQGVTDVDVTIGTEADVTTVRIDQWQPTAGVPSFAKKIVGERTNIIQEERWTGGTDGEITVTIPGKPGAMTGTAIVRTTDDGRTLETVTLTVKVSIPLISGKLEGLIGDLLLKALKAEHKVGRDYLSR